MLAAALFSSSSNGKHGLNTSDILENALLLKLSPKCHQRGVARLLLQVYPAACWALYSSFTFGFDAGAQGLDSLSDQML